MNITGNGVGNGAAPVKSLIAANTVAIKEVSNAVDSLSTMLDSKVPTSRTINGKALTADIALLAGDVGTYTKAEIDNLSLITLDDIDEICGQTIINASEVTY